MKKIVLNIVLLIGIVSVSYAQSNQFEGNRTAYVVKEGVRIDDPKLAIEYLNSNLEKVNNIIDRSLAPVEKAKIKLFFISHKINKRTYIRMDEIFINLF